VLFYLHKHLVTQFHMPHHHLIIFVSIWFPTHIPHTTQHLLHYLLQVATQTESLLPLCPLQPLTYFILPDLRLLMNLPYQLFYFLKLLLLILHFLLTPPHVMLFYTAFTHPSHPLIVVLLSLGGVLTHV